MRKGWTYRKLGDICEVINGLWTGKKAPFITVAVIRNTNFSKDCRLKLDDVAYLDVETKQYSSRKLKPGDIIIEKSGGSEKQPVGRPVLFDIEEGDYSFSNFTATLRIKEGEIVNPTFLHRCLYGHYVKGETLRMQSKTTGLHNLDMKAFLRLPIPNLPVAEQERIVAELDLLQGIIDKQKAKLKELDTLAQSIFYDMFGDPETNDKGWEIKTIGAVCAPKKNIRRAVKFFCKDDRISYIDISSIDNIKNVITTPTLYRFGDAPSRAQQVVEINDILISLVRPNLNNVAIVSLDDTNLVASSGFCVLRASSIIQTAFLFFIVKMKSFTEYLMQRVSGANYPAVREDDITGYPMIVPPLTLQQAFATKIEAIERQKASINASIAETQKLFDYTMDKYFG